MTSPLVAGEITELASGEVTGWLASPGRAVTPLLLVGGRAARLEDWPFERPDVTDRTGIPGEIGFRFTMPSYHAGEPIELYALLEDHAHLVVRTTAPFTTTETVFSRQMKAAAEVANQPDAVAVITWEAGHNPIGRAKVLYDVLQASGRPAVLFAYTFAEFGGRLWEPLTDARITLVTVPWQQRGSYHRVLRASGFRFQSAWLCKPRYPTFELAAQICSPATRLVLDLDDNEEHFSRSDPSFRKAYGMSSIGISRMLTERIPARTVASASLQEEYGGWVVRHARAAERPVRGLLSPGNKPFRLGFVGTVRPHKNLLAAAEAVRIANWSEQLDVELHVLGDFAPPELRDELEAAGVRTGGMVPSRRLGETIASLDAVLTGYPSADPEQAGISRFQISAKIGDALANGRPVLVPNGPSVGDLGRIDGIHLFDESTFPRRLRDVVRSARRAKLPREFTLTNAYEGFHAAEAAAQLFPAAGSVLVGVRGAAALPAEPRSQPGHTLLLIWKQQDAGLYGRRIDQVARAHRRARAEDRVVVLELLPPGKQASLEQRATDHLSDAPQVLRLLERKLRGGHIDSDGVEYHALDFQDRPAASTLETFLIDQDILPATTTVVLFPIVPEFLSVQDVLSAYRVVADVVDNQFSWVRGNPKTMAAYAQQYAALLRFADHICFNSAINRQAFIDTGLLTSEEVPVSLVENWYALPHGFVAEQGPSRSERAHLIYTGNMSDRFDWALLHRIIDLDAKPWVHLVGAAERSPRAPLRRALASGRAIFHGPCNELETLRLLSHSDVAIMPHMTDHHSTFMNPLKVRMYAALGLPVVGTAVPGVTTSEGDGVILVKGRPGFVREVTTLIEERRGCAPIAPAAQSIPPGARPYLAIIDTLRPAGAQRAASTDLDRNDRRFLPRPVFDRQAYGRGQVLSDGSPSETSRDPSRVSSGGHPAPF